MSLCDATASELSRLIDRGETRPSEILLATEERIGAVENAIGSYITLDLEGAAKRANALETRPLPSEKRSPLWGVPLAVKDNICTKRLRTTCASRMLENYVPPYDATAVERLEKAGAVVVGKTNLDEFGMGSSTEHSALGETRNPWSRGRVPGGSSGGSAAAVAAGEAVVALGSDTGGSVRLPAAFCGVVGVRPTYGVVSRYGLVAFGSSLDQVGVIGRDARDCASVIEAIAGPDGRDSTAPRAPDSPGGRSFIGGDLSGVTVGVPYSFLEEGVDPDVRAAFEAALEDLRVLGVKVESVELQDPSYSVSTYYILADCEASSNLARFDGVRYGRRSDAETYDELVTKSRSLFLGPEVKRRIVLGTFALSAGYYDRYYATAVRARSIIAQDMSCALEKTEFLATPTAPCPAFKMGERLGDPLTMYLTDVFTVGPSLAGLPAVSVPMGLSRDGLPMGLQIIGRPFQDFILLALADAFLMATGHNRVIPPIVKTRGKGDSNGD